MSDAVHTALQGHRRFFKEELMVVHTYELLELVCCRTSHSVEKCLP
jgi:hypothetical protein